MNDYSDLKRRVDDFMLMKLPGQPFGMHMGTSYLVHDLWDAIQALQQDAARYRWLRVSANAKVGIAVIGGGWTVPVFGDRLDRLCDDSMKEAAP